MKADFHIHTRFSKDSQGDPEETVQSAIQKGLKSICITDHVDLDYSEPGFEIDFEEYFLTWHMLQEKYKRQIDIRIGMEFGLQAHLGKACKEMVTRYPFDFILGSLHLVDGQDPYYRKCFENTTDQAIYQRTFELTLESIRNIFDFDVLGHIDYIVRYGKKQAEGYSYQRYADLIDEILKHLIANGKGLEVNTAGWKSGLDFAHPHSDVLKRYKELGGEIITIGSDGHRPEHIAYGFEKVKDYIEACGFKYYTEFRQRKPIFCALSSK